MIFNDSMDDTTSCGHNGFTDAASSSWISGSLAQCVFVGYGKVPEVLEDDLWMNTDRREWRKYLRALWLEVLRLKHCFTLKQYSKCKLYYRRLLISISGWLARKGYVKKN